MNKKFLLSVAVVTLGIFILPNTMALFSGQHTFDKAGNGTICAKCHSDVEEELAASAYHTSFSNEASGYKCKACHSAGTIQANLIPIGNGTNGSSSVNAGLNITSGSFTAANGTVTTGLNLHAAITVECMSCHYGVNFTDDAHKPFADNTTSQTWLKGANEACIGCHTKTKVFMTWARKGGYNYSYDFETKAGTLTFNNTYVNTTTNNTG